MLPLARSSALRSLRPSLQRPSLTNTFTLARSLSSLTVLEQRDGKINTSSLGAITAAHKLGGSITAFVAGPKAMAEEASKVKGVEKVLTVDNSAYDKVGIDQATAITKTAWIWGRC